jgi:hypothetical protein
MRRTISLLLLLLLPATALACSSSASPPDSSVESTDRDKAEIEAVLVEWNRRYRAALHSPAGDHPELAELAVDPLLARVQNQLRAFVATRQHENDAPKPQASFTVVGVMPDGPRAAATVCEVNDYWIVRDGDGTPTDSSVNTTKLRFELVRHASKWRLADATNHRRSEGVQPCDA